MYLLDNQDHMFHIEAFMAVALMFARFRPFNVIMNSMKGFGKIS